MGMNLLMLTKHYPFGTGEAFIENEMEVLSTFYDEILIVACEVSASDQKMRKVPANVVAVKIPRGSPKVDAIKGIARLFARESEMAAEKQNAKGIVSKAFLGYFEEKSQRVFDCIMANRDIHAFCTRPFVLYSYWLFMTARVGMLMKDPYHPRYMFTRAHRYDLYEEKNRAQYLPYRRRFLRAYDCIFPCSENGTAYLKTRYPEYADKVHTGFLGTLDHGIGRGSTDGVFRMVSCSRVEPLKRVDRIIDALCILDNAGMAIEWTHIGGGSELEKMRRQAKAKLKRIRYKFCGSLENAAVIKKYQSEPFDLFINVSASEGLPVSIMEAISFGIPVLGTDVGGTSEIVVDGKTGKLVAADCTREELAGMIRSFADRANGVVKRASCRLFWEEHFQAMPNYQKLCRFVEEQYKPDRIMERCR